MEPLSIQGREPFTDFSVGIINLDLEERILQSISISKKSPP